MASAGTIEEVLSKPNVIHEIAKSIQSGSCEIKFEGNHLVIVKIERTIKYKT